MDFSKLKKAGSNLEALSKAIDEQSKSTNFQDDESYWKPTIDKAGNGAATIRLLPAPPQDGDGALPWVKYWRHSFQGPGGWYIENSLTTLGQPDPVSEYNTQLWNTGLEANKNLARQYKRKQVIVSNIYVVTDPADTTNESNVFRYRYGVKLFNKFQEPIAGIEDEDEEGKIKIIKFDPFSFWEGANFRIKAKTEDKYLKYDDSKFSTPKPLSKNDADLQEIWNKEYSLLELIAPEKFKSYTELKERLNKVLGLTTGVTTVEVKAPIARAESVSKTQVSDNLAHSIDTNNETPPWEPPEENAEETMKYFESLAAS